MLSDYLKPGHRSADPVLLTKDDRPITISGWTHKPPPTLEHGWTRKPPFAPLTVAQAKEIAEYQLAVRAATKAMGYR